MKDPLYGNKVAAAVLIVLLLAVGLPTVVGTLRELSEHLSHHDDHESPYPGGVLYLPGSLEVAAVEEEEKVDLGTLLAAASAERGQAAAAICASCHSFEKGGVNGTGPNLWDIVNRPVANVSGFSYTSALQGLGGVWSYERLDPYLENSQGYVSGTQMAQKIRKENKRADILAYLGTLSDDPVPFPEPAPVEEAAGDELAEGTEDALDESAAGEVATGTEAGLEGAGGVIPEGVMGMPSMPGEATLPDSEVNNPGDDGYPGDDERQEPEDAVSGVRNGQIDG